MQIRNNPQYGIRQQNRFVSQDTFGIRMPIPTGGIDTISTPRDIKDGNVSAANNVWTSSDGFIEVIPGYESWGNINKSRVLGVYKFFANPTTKFRIFCYADDVANKAYMGYYNTSGVFTQLLDTLDLNQKVGFAPYINNKGTQIVADTTATSGSATGITKTGAGWTVNAYKGKIVNLISGTGSGQFKQILSNTADTITISGSNWDTNPDATTHFTILELGNSLYFKQEGTTMWGFDGTNVTTYTNKPKGNALGIWKERLLIGGADDMVFHASAPFNPTDFSGKGSFFGNVGSENGQKSTGFMTLAQDRLAVFKENSYQIINGIQGTTDVPIVSAESVVNTIGAAGIRAFCEVPSSNGNGALLVGRDRNIYPFGYLKDVLSGVVGTEEEISGKVINLFNIDETELKNVSVSYDDYNSKIWISYKVQGVTNVLIYDIQRKELNPFWYSSDMDVEQVIVWDNEVYFTSATAGRMYKFTPTAYTRLGASYDSYVIYKEYAGKTLNPKVFDRVIFSMKNATGNMLVKARITDVDEVHQLSTDIPMGSAVEDGGGSGGAPSGLIASGGIEPVYDIAPSRFIKRTMELDDIVGHSIEVECASTGFMSIGSFSIEGENYSEDEEDINIQY